MTAVLREFLDADGKRTKGEWEEGWNVRYFGGDKSSMCGRGPDTMVLSRSDPRYQDLVANPAFADAAFIAAASKIAPALRALLDEVEGLRKRAALHDAMERAANELREGWIIEVNVERGAGYVVLSDEQGNLLSIDGADQTLSEQVDAAIAAARASA